MADPIDMKLCPVCGSFPVHHTDVSAYSIEGWMYWVGCANSRCLHGPLCTTSEQAVTAWNRLGENEQLRVAVDAIARNVYALRNIDGEGWMAHSNGTGQAPTRGDTLRAALVALINAVKEVPNG